MENFLNKEKVLKVIDRIEGTLISDLISLKSISEELYNNDLLSKKLPGGINFTLFLTGLVACETLGYFLNKSSSEGDTKKNIEYFLSSAYFNSPELNKKHYKEALVSLRTNLAHVYGMTDLRMNEIDKELILCVGSTEKSVVMSYKNTVKLNGLKFIELILNAFESIKTDILKGKDIIRHC